MDEFQECFHLRNRLVAERILDDDFALELVHPTAVRLPRDRWFQMLEDYIVHAWEVQQQFLTIDGDCAVNLQLVLMKATVLGEDRSGLFIISDTWRRRDQSWRLWRRHSTPITAGSMPAARS